MSAEPLDLGSGCEWDWSLGNVEDWNVQGEFRMERDGETLGIVGGMLWHPVGPKPDFPVEYLVRPGMCAGGVSFTRPKKPSEREAKSPVWEVNSLEPLDISPSVLCSCGFHGFIKQGKWVPA